MPNRPRWYVYALVDPRTGRPFYIGKGTGQRISGHEAAVRAGRDKNPAKSAIIKSIWAAGLQVGKQVIAFFWKEADALAFEREQIHSTKNLTNIAGGQAGISRKVSLLTLFGQICLAPKGPKRASRALRLVTAFKRQDMRAPEHFALWDAANSLARAEI